MIKIQKEDPVSIELDPFLFILYIILRFFLISRLVEK